MISLADIASWGLVGVERRRPDFTGASGRVGELLANMGERSDSERLLAAAGIVSMYERGGRIPGTTADPLPPQAAAEKLVVPRPHGSLYLGLLLQGEHIDLLPEWLELLVGIGGRIPEEYLPIILDRGARDNDLRGAIIPVLGERGRWLAGFNPSWEYAQHGVNESEWGEGTRIARIALLEWLRTTDPERGRTLLESTWSEETAEDRAEFIQKLAAGLTMQDEPFLEGALDDRRAEVRGAAAGLLLRLAGSSVPGPRLAIRAEAQVGTVISIRETRRMIKLIRHRELIVHPPDECSATMQRDGIDQRPRYGLGEQASWLMGVIERVRLDYWTETLPATPEQLIALGTTNQWREPLIAGWMQATLHQRNVAWATALLDANIDEILLAEEDLLSILPQSECERRIVALLDATTTMTPGDRLYRLLSSLPRPWSRTISRRLYTMILDLVRGQNAQPWQWISFIERTSRLIDPTDYHDASERMSAIGIEKPEWKNILDKFVRTVRFRYEMTEALR
jgi:hypothetical protein